MPCATAPAIIETERLRLRPLAATDADALIEWMSDRAVTDMLARPPHPYRRAHANAFIAWARVRPWERAIDAGDGLIGCIGITEHLGYWLARPHWGRGLMTEAATALIGAWFDATGEARLVSGHFVDNPVSARILARLGFRETGRRQLHSAARGRQREHVDMALTRDDWEDRA